MSKPSVKRPASLEEAIHRAADDMENLRFYIDGFLDDFYLDNSREGRLARIQHRPEFQPDERINALCGAIGEHLSRRWMLKEIPAWTDEPERFLRTPWLIGPEKMHAFYLAESPSAYRRRLIFTEAEPLRRARTPRDGRWWGYEQLRCGLAPTPEEVEEFSKRREPY